MTLGNNDNYELLGQGDHEFPFTLEVPKGLPSSYSIKSDDQDCSVYYNLHVNMDNENRSWGIFRSKAVKNKINIVMIGPSRSSSSGDGNGSGSVGRPKIVEPDTKQIIFCGCCCCINTGYISVGASCNSDIYNYNSIFGTRVVVNNSSTSDIKHIQVCMIERAYWNVGSHTCSVNTTVWNGNIKPDDHLLGTKKIFKKKTFDSHENKENLNNLYRQLVDVDWSTIYNESSGGSGGGGYNRDLNLFIKSISSLKQINSTYR